ncbi:MAG: radical SAM protein [Candidatus Hodarchaeota archaeon]
MYDPVRLAVKVEKLVTKNHLKKYYRFRGAPFYGSGVSTADCVGCALRCVFCWSGFPRDSPEKAGKFYTPDQVAAQLIRIAEKRGFSKVRISGNEPTIGESHLISLLNLMDKTSHRFILETSGILIDSDYSAHLSAFHNLHVRVSLKGTSNEEYTLLTGARPESFDLQLKAIENLLEAGVSVHASIMVSFSSNENTEKLIKRLHQIDPNMFIEKEYVILYPLVIKRLRNAKINPIVAYDRSGNLCSLPSNPRL